MNQGPKPQFTAVVLAANRGGDDPVAAMAGCSHKCLVPVGGQAMLARVLRALAASDSVGAMAVSIDDAAVLGNSDEIAALIERHDIALIDAAETPSISVTHAVDVLAGDVLAGAVPAGAAPAEPWPILITTADVPLLSPGMVDHFCGEARATAADLAVGLASATVVLEKYPDAMRTFMRFRDGRYTGCNLFALMTPAAMAAITFWRRVEADRKRPWRIFKTFGPLAMVRFLAGGATLDAAMGAASARLGLTAAAVKMPYADAAIDVDKPAHKKLVENIIRGQGDV